MIFSLFAFFLTSLPVVFTQSTLVTSPQLLVGTWSSGSKNVVTGPGFASPANTSFTYPSTTGVSYSFTSDGYYEIARYRFNGNATKPKCITGIMNWCHGTYEIQPNNSIIMTPFGDGYQQIQDPCSAVTNFVENYNDTEFYQNYEIFQDPTEGYKLYLFGFDGTPVAPQFQLSTSPNMLPTRSLRNVSAPPDITTNNGLTTEHRKRSSAESRWSRTDGGLITTIILTTLVGGIAGPLFL
jgi:hypothetical protein